MTKLIGGVTMANAFPAPTIDRKRINEADFATGLFVTLSARSITNLGVLPIDKAVVAAFNLWSPIAAAAGFELWFAFFLDPVHQDSRSVRTALGGAISRGVAHMTSDHQLLIDITPDAAEHWLDRLPGDRALWHTLGALLLAELGCTSFVPARTVHDHNT